MAGEARTRVLLAACPPWRTECPNLALAYLSAMLRSRGIGTWVGDLNILLYNRSEAQLRRYWDLSTSSFWARPEAFKDSFTPPMLACVDGFVDELAEREGDLIGFSAQSANVMFTLELVRRLRARGCKKTIVLGGPAVRLRTPGDARSVGLTGFKGRGLDDAAVNYEIRGYLDMVDVFVEGEGELTLVELAERHEAGVSLEDTQGAIVWNRGAPAAFEARPAVPDLDALPAPSFEEFDLAAYGQPFLPFLTSRGCVRKCAMCYERILWPGYRHRSIGAIVAEMRGHIERWGIQQFSCNDLLLNGNLLFLGKLCDALSESRLDVHWWGNAVVHRLMDRDLFRRMRAGGVEGLVYGIESGSQKILRKMRKGYLIEDADTVLGYGMEFGIKNVINLIVGFPGETAEDHEATMQFVRRNRESIHQVAVLAMCMIYPHSPLAEQFEYYGIDPATLETFNPNTVVIEWKDVTGLDLAARQARFWELFRLIRGYGIDVVGVEDEEEMTPGLVSELVERLSSPTGWVREDAMVRLARAVEPGLVPVMVRAVSDESFLVAGQALVNLSRLDPDRAYELAAPMLSRVVSYVDLCAAIAVAKRTDDRTMDLLENRLNARLYTKHSTDLALALAPHRKLYAAFEEFAAAAAGGQAEERSDGALQRLLGHESAWVRRRGLRWLLETRMDLAASKARDLDAAFADPDSGVRRLALELAHRARLSASPEALERLLADPDDSVRAWAAALSASPVARQARSLVAGGNWPPETASEFLKLLALRTSESPGTVEQLSKVFAPALSDGSPAIRLEALRELLAREDWRCLPEVLPALSDPDAQVRRRAAEYVGRAGDLSAQLSLLPLLSDPDLFVMQEATAALARMRSPLVWRHLGRFVLETTCGELPDFMAAPIQACVDAFKQVLAFEPLARAGDRTALRSIWESSGPMERAFLLALFQRTGTGEANFDLVKRSLSDSEAEVRVLGLAILEELGDPGAVPAVMALVQDPWFECRAGACRFLSRVRHGPARPALLHLLHDAHDHVKEWAARGLGRLGNPADAHVLEDLLGEANFARLPADAQADLEPLFRQLHRRGVQ